MRQVLEVQVQDAEQAPRLQAELSRVYHQRIVPLIDRCCTELSGPDRVYRIDSLQLDLGTIDPGDIEEDMVTRLEEVLPDALAERVRSQERDGGRSEQDAREMSRLELFALFARTGALPWWADASQPNLLDDVVRGLIRDAPVPLSRMMRELAREPRILKRVVLHHSRDTLSALCRLLAPHPGISLDRFPSELVAVLHESEVSGRARDQLGDIVWLGILRTAASGAGQDREPSAFWKEALLQIGLESGATYTSLVSGLRRRIQVAETSGGGPLRPIAEALFEELWGEAGRTEALIEALERLQRSGGALGTLSAALRPTVSRLPDALKAQLLAVLTPPGDRASESEMAKQIAQALRLCAERHAIPSPLARQWLAELRKREASTPSTDALSELTETLREAVQDDVLPESDVDEVSVDLSFSDSDDLYVDNSGLVLLWPFLGRFFERLGLLEEGRFKDASAVQRAVGLLQYVATEDPSPPEYSLPLNKVLCGVDVTEVFDFGPPVTETEAEECANLLGAAIGHAPILKDMSIPGFRGTFLLREGVLGTRDGAWLLRVERESYDVVLERFPWAVDWVRLPWMEAPLRVEW